MTKELPDLAATLRPRPAPASPPATAEVKPPEGSSRTKRVKQSSEQQPARRVTQSAPGASRGGDPAWSRTIAYGIPRSVRVAVGASAKAAGVTMTAWILSALNDHYREIRIEPPRQSAAAAGDLFAIPQREQPEAMVQSTMRVTDEQLQAIQTLVDQHNTSRSALLTAAVRLKLDKESGVST